MSARTYFWMRVGLVLAIPMLLFASGCSLGGGSEVSGTVTYKGSALPGGSIVFKAADGKEYGGAIGKDGKYFVDKIPTGSMKVYFNMPAPSTATGAQNVPKGMEEDMKKKMKPPPGVPAEAMKAYGDKDQNKVPEIPAKYKNADTSGLTYDVKSGKNTYDVPLSD